MISTTNPALYENALEQIRLHKMGVGRLFRGRFVQMFLGLKFYQNVIPSMHSGSFVSSGVLQSMLDDLYAKASRSSNSAVLMLFENSYHARTGIVGIGNRRAQNTWRNNFNIQKGIGCYAPVGMLASRSFQNQNRSECQYLDPASGGTFNGARCALCPTGSYRNESHRKWLRIDPGGNGYAAIDSSDVSNFAPYVAPSGQRLPLLPLLIAVYHDADPGLVIGSRRLVTPPEFAMDFNFSAQECLAYFDDSPDNPFNAAILAADPSIQYTPGWGGAVATSVPASASSAALPAAIPVPVLFGTQVAPPLVNSGWGAQQVVATALTDAGWSVHDVSRQSVGYDLLAKKDQRTIYVEVKSSTAVCTPSLTAREWSQASRLGSNYILAIIENFNEMQPSTVYWVVDPVHTCVAVAATTVTHRISRSSWAASAVALSAIV